jgi:hypothetical protein
MKWVLIAAAGINAVLVVVGFAQPLLWSPTPNDPQLSQARWIASQVLAGTAAFLCIPLVMLVGAIGLASWRASCDRLRPADPCLRCGHDRRGLGQGALCPECGAGPRL